jgi:hypothetical protein
MSTKEKLYAPFQNIQSRRGRGGTYDYVSWKDVADRMNNVFGTNWSSEVRSQEDAGDTIVVRVRVLATDPETGGVQYQEGFGGAQNDEKAEAGNPFKAAYSKALKDACKKWGVGLYLDEDTDSSGNMTPEPLPPGYMGKEVGVPPSTPAAGMPSVPPMSTPPPVEEKPTFVVDTPQMVKKFPEPAPVTPLPSNTVSTPVAVGLAMPPGVEMNVSSGTVITQEEPAVVAPPEPVAPTTPSIPTPPPAPASMPLPPTVNLSANEKPMAAKAPTIHVGEPESISDVQKAALHSILSIKGVEYETLVGEAFTANGVVKTPVPGPDDLTYQEAVFVVKYGNDKFRRR